MNKNDIKLVVILFLVAVILVILIRKNDIDNGVANVYYENQLILTIDLSDTSYEEYSIMGFNGNVLIARENGSVRVLEENSPLHLCSTQGAISKGYESIICLPNKIIIKIEENSELDATIG